MRVPLALLEPNSILGLANKLVFSKIKAKLGIGVQPVEAVDEVADVPVDF